MPSASLAVVRRAQPDMVRVAALSVAITLNLAALLLAMRPLAPQLADAVQTVKVATVRLIEPPPKTPPPPDIILKPLIKPVPVAAPVHVVRPQPVTPPVAVPTTEPTDNPKPVVITPPAKADPQPPSMAPGVVSLAYRSSPLKFPVQALRQRMSGTVILRVLVDESGKPVDVIVEQSSGFHLLDDSAREQVLAKWLFQPAVIDGHAVRAWARVPVSFAFQQM